MKEKEYFDIVDENGMPTGETVDRSEAHRKGILHRTVHIWVTRTENDRLQVLLQKRSKDKDSFPGLYDTSSAGHILAGDEPLESARRELKEELGIDADPDQLAFAGNFRVHFALPFHGEMFRDDEVVFIYHLKSEVDAESLTLQKEELEEVRWFDLQEVYEECISQNRKRFCVPTEGLEVLAGYLGIDLSYNSEQST